MPGRFGDFLRGAFFETSASLQMETVAKAGRYEIVGELGRGAMGIVYKAVDPVIGRTVAVKTIRLSEEGTGLKRSELLARFQTEARAAGLLTHPNIVVVYDAGEEDGLYYITMELVEGKSLQALLDGGHSFPLPRTLRILDQTCSALQFAHERNVVHRDIKPANLMLTADDTVKITDFGTAKILQFGSTQQTSHVMGTPSYMSPEQVKGRAVDGRTDIFSLGVMLYEMVTGEKPFPGQNITTVIYKIVNEDPVPPRQIDPSIHPGISTVVMKALAKEPEQRYQSCREMVEDLRNYRAHGIAGGNPNSTMVMGGGSPAATIVSHNPKDDPAVIATAHSLSARAASPGQTPVVRRTGTIAPHAEPVEPPKKKSVVGTVFAALLLLAVIVYGANKMKPVFEAARALHNSQVKESQSRNSAAAATGTAPDNSGANSPASDASQGSNEAAAATEETSAAPKPVDPAPEKAAPKKPDNSLTPKAAEYKGRIEEAISEHGFAGRAKVQGTGSTLTLAGKLRPSEHGELLKFLRSAPPSVHVIDHIEYDDTAASAASGSDDSSHPVPASGRGAIHVITDVIGATARLHGPGGNVLNKCDTPCSFNNLRPERYSLEVQKEGYQPLQTALQIKGNEVQDQKLKLEPLAKGIFISTQPPAADVFINGAKQAGQTPVVLPLAPGQYNLVIRLQGYEAYSGSIQVKDIQTQLNIELTERSATHVAWAQVNSNPKGAEIIVDGNSTGQFTPARIQIPTGLHTVTLKLDGYQRAKRTVQASEGGTVPVNLTLQK
ncbi:MAG TPA: PEGA domain-containing protein [Candidatus Acidoferrum sp.]|nr:PEGA domain-containing protein [Candidatus Acidoferrum sp.]